MPKSELEARLAFQIRALSLPRPQREQRFHPTRRWRADFLWPDHQLIVEVDGGVYSRGRHTRGTGYTKDCEKQAEAVLLGYRVMRFTGGQVESGYAANVLERFFGGVS